MLSSWQPAHLLGVPDDAGEVTADLPERPVGCPGAVPLGGTGRGDPQRERPAQPVQPLLGLDQVLLGEPRRTWSDRKSTRLNSSHPSISYAVFCLKKKKHDATLRQPTPASRTRSSRRSRMSTAT